MKTRDYVLLLLTLFFTGQVTGQPYGIDTRVPNDGFQISTAGGPLTLMRLEQVFTGLSFDFPLLLTHAGDGSNRLFVIEKKGIIYVFENDYQTPEASIFLNLTGPVRSTFSEAGLLGLAFHPDYSQNGKFYVHYNIGDLWTRICEYKVSDNPNLADPASERIIMQFKQPYRNHNGGMIAFGQDGYLYLSFGDGGSAGDPSGNGQNRTTLLGSILRIDVDNKDPGLEYAVPPDNPFVGNTTNWRPEIWAYGLRNVWRFSFDRLTGDLWAGDVGQNRYEEIDLILKGGNYGWNVMEGRYCYSPPSGCGKGGLEMPVMTYDHERGHSVTGGYVYRGTRLLRLYGTYLYGDFVTRWVWGFQYNPGGFTNETFLTLCPSSITSFGEDEAGEVYIVGQDGRIYIFQEQNDTPPPELLPRLLSETGLYTNMAALTPADGLLLYDVISPLWSDGAFKTRFMAMPGTTEITFRTDSAWGFPDNGILVKNFFLDMEEGHPESREIIETRFLIKHEYDTGWDGFSYQWRSGQTEADLLDSSAVQTYTILQKDGSAREQTWYFPSRSDCQICHTPASGWALSTRTVQLNRDHDYGQVTDNQLRTLNHIGLFTEDIGENVQDLPKLTAPSDTSATLEARVRSYMDANCANCHVVGGSGRSDMDLRYNIPLDSANIIGISWELDDLGITGAMRIKSGEPDSSIVLLRMLSLTDTRMPPLATNRIDSLGTGLLKAWILSMGDTLMLPDTTGMDTTSVDTTDIDTTDIDTSSTGIGRYHKPDRFSLSAPRPNPFNPVTQLEFGVPVLSVVTVTVYDVRGRRMDLLINNTFMPGYYQVSWPQDVSGMIESGLYFAVITANPAAGSDRPPYRETRKLILLK